MVRYVSTCILAALRNERFFSITEVNDAVHERLDELNRTPFRKRDGCRRDIYLEEEKAFMKPLPTFEYEPSTWTPNITVGYDYRVDVECFLTTYEYAQTKAYVEKQFTYAGRTSPLFTDEALRCIYDYSSGLLRLINQVCTQALGFTFQNGNSIVDDHIVKIVLTTELNIVA